MTWTLETSNGLESDKIAAIAVPYLQGRGVDAGCGLRKVWPSAIGIDNGHHFGRGGADIQGDSTDLSMFADGSLDYVFSSHMLEHIERAKVPDVLREWTRALKTGGHLVLYIPSGNLYPRIGESGANPDHKWDPMPGDVEEMLRDIGGWELLESGERGDTNEYSLFIVARKAEGWSENIWQRNPDGKKRALIVRYGAIGDQIVAASILPGLKAQGYHVTYNTTPEAQQVLLHDPHVDEWLIQAKDFVPNEQLGPYWDSLKERYDRIINLCESIEGALLTIPGRLPHGYPEVTRRRMFGAVNYLERTHDIADVPYDFAPKFYATAAEKGWAVARKRAFGGAPVVTWAINGSAPHKVYGWTQIVIAWLLERTPAHVCLLADPGVGKDLQVGIMQALKEHGADIARVHPMGGGVLTIRQALAFSQVSDCVVGPETGPLNTVCFEPMPKVIYLSHSSHENLTKHWINTTVLEPDRAKAPCYPCHRLHSTWEHCHQDKTTYAALCASAISPERVFEAIAFALGAVRKAA